MSAKSNKLEFVTYLSTLASNRKTLNITRPDVLQLVNEIQNYDLEAES